MEILWNSIILWQFLIERMVDDAWGRLTHLIKFIKGEAKEMVKNLLEVTTWGGVRDCKEIAAWKIWRSRKITAAYKNQIKKWPDAYRKFQNFLIKCENIDQIQDWNVLNTPDLFVCWFQSCWGVGEIGGLEKSWQ